jgi:ribosomal protein L11 methyltransferase
MNKQWIEATITGDAQLSDAAANCCHEHGAEGVVLEDAEEGACRIKAYFTEKGWSEAADSLRNYLADLAAAHPELPPCDLSASPLDHQNWAVMWKDNFKPVEVGRRLVVTPPWITPDAAGREIIVIEPAEAFGTGAHETTQGCLALLEEALERSTSATRHPSLLDVGCGSGILALAGVKLGAKPVAAVDNDPIAIESARANAALNGASGEIAFRRADLQAVEGPWDVVTANLDPLTLTRNVDRLIVLATQFLVVSGVPVEQWASVKALFLDKGVQLRREILGEEWAAALFATGMSLTLGTPTRNEGNSHQDAKKRSVRLSKSHRQGACPTRGGRSSPCTGFGHCTGGCGVLPVTKGNPPAFPPTPHRGFQNKCTALLTSNHN